VSQLLNAEHRQERAERRVHYPFVAVLFVALAALEWFGYLTQAPRRPVLYTLLAVCAVVAALGRNSRVRHEISVRRLYRTALERNVAEHLDELRQRGARVFNDVHIGGKNVDHVVICTHGIYVIEAKTWQKPWDTATIQLYGEQAIHVDVAPDCNPVRQASSAARWLEGFFDEAMDRPATVRGVVVFPRAWVPQASAQGVVCLSDPKTLPSFIRRQPQVLDARTVKTAAAYLSRHLRDPVPRALPKVTSR
jgi:hypothetical protein